MATQRKTVVQRRSLYVKHNKAYEVILASLIVFFVAICGFVFGSVVDLNSTNWSNNTLIQMIVGTNAAMRGR